MLFDCFLEQCFPWQANKSDLSILKVQLLWTQSELPKQKNKKKGRLCGTRGFTTGRALSQICFGFLFFIPQQRGPSTKLLITEWTAVMSPDATRDFLILDQNNLMFDLRWRKPEPIVTIWCGIQLAVLFSPPFFSLCSAGPGFKHTGSCEMQKTDA